MLSAVSGFLDAFKNLSPMEARNVLDVAPRLPEASNEEGMDLTSLSAEVDFQRHGSIDPELQGQFSLENEGVPGADKATDYNALLKTAQLDPNATVDYEDDGLRHMNFTMPAGQQREIVADPQSGSLSETLQGANGGRTQEFDRDGEVLTGHSETGLDAADADGGGGGTEGEHKKDKDEEEGGAYEASEIASHLGHAIGEFGHALQEVSEVMHAGQTLAPAVNALAASSQAEMNAQAAAARPPAESTAAPEAARAPAEPTALPEAAPAARPPAGPQAVPEAASAARPPAEPRPTPHTLDMQEYVDSVRNAGQREAASAPRPATGPASAAPKPVVAATGPAGAATQPGATETAGATPKPAGATEPAGASTEPGGIAEEAGAVRTGLKAFNRVFIPAGGFFAAAQTVGGVKDLAHGKLVDGGLETAGGAAGTVSSLAAGAETTGLASGSTVVAGVATVGSIAAGAGIAAIADGALDAWHGYKTGNHELEAVGGVKGLGGGLLVAGAVSLNPFLVAAGAGVYTGALIYEHRAAIEHGAEVAGHAIASGARAAGTAVVDGVSTAGSALANGATSVAHKVASLLPW